MNGIEVLIVEDDEAISAGLALNLKIEGCMPAAVLDGETALARLKEGRFDLVLLDISLPGITGLDVLAALRDGGDDTPVIVLSARRDEFDKVAALRLGADDYVTKDTSLPHLVARIAALFRRSDLSASAPATDDVIERGPLTLDVKRFTADWNGQRVALTLTEFWMVHALARYPGHVKDRESLMRDARIVVDDSTITSHVKRIRRKFQAVDAAFDRIATVYGMGYRWDPH